MADVTLADVLQGRDQQANNFGPLTPEQEAMLRRGVTTEAINPLEMLIGGGVGGVAGRAIGRGIGHAGDMAGAVMFPGMDAMARMAGHNPSGLINWAGRVGGGLGGMLGVGAGANMATERARMNTMRDAEGQDGGFYGPASPMDAEGQPGGFYGRRK
tara:strand:- start:378 stop:848 length:471 start_codon:yes stop_codon:yes gene_type:complete